MSLGSGFASFTERQELLDSVRAGSSEFGPRVAGQVREGVASCSPSSAEQLGIASEDGS